MRWLTVVLPLLWAISACDCGQQPPPPAPPQPTLPGAGQVVSLDGPWRLTARINLGSGWRELPAREVQVPGYAFPFNAKQPAEAELIFERPLAVPPDLARHRIVVELDSVDYFAAVELVDEQGGVRPLGEHQGYCGRFAVDLGRAPTGSLRVRVRDRWERATALEQHPRATVQGIDPTGWGVNPMGILGSVRLRAVGNTHVPEPGHPYGSGAQ